MRLENCHHKVKRDFEDSAGPKSMEEHEDVRWCGGEVLEDHAG